MPADRMTEAQSLATEAENCAVFYEGKPGAIGHMTTVDLYRAIARLARIVEQQQVKLDHLMPDKSDDV